MLPACLPPAQTIDEIKAIIVEARKPHGIPMGATVENDDYIDDGASPPVT
jgi:hypothetical protein